MSKVLLPIEYDDLLVRLADPDSNLDHYLGYMIEVSVPDRMGPELQPNPSLVTDIPPRIEGGVGMGLANAVMRTRRHRLYRRRISNGWRGHRIVSEGDSWFQYPTSLLDIIDHLMVDHAILSLDAAGDRLVDILDQREILLNLKAERASALLLSAGGNDLFDNGQLGRLVEAPFPGATGEALVGPVLDTFLSRMSARYLELFRSVHRAFPNVLILIHGYGPAFPRGGAWIGRPLSARGVPAEVQHDVVKTILRKFNGMLATLARRSEFHGKLVHIDLTGIGTRPGDWHDEIHLNAANAARAADRFRKALAERLGGPAPEDGMPPSAEPSPAEALAEEGEPPTLERLAAAVQAERLSALDERTLLRELDLRVELLELDPTLADEAEIAPLVIGRPAPELGIASLHAATRRLIKWWESELRALVCDGAGGPDNAVEAAVLEALAKSRSHLSGALARWLVTGPLALPAVLASALAAWLATRFLDAGRNAYCAARHPGPAAPALDRRSLPDVPTTMGEMRARFDTPGGAADFSADGRSAMLDRLDEDLAHKVVEPPNVPVDADAASKFRLRVKRIIELLGGEPDDTRADDNTFGLVESLIIADGTRPALYVRDGFVDLTDERLTRGGWLDRVRESETHIRRLVAASGRIVRGSDRSANAVYGSAWMLPDGRVATARHVIESRDFAEEINGTWVIKDPSFAVDFGVELGAGTDPDRVFRIAAVDWAGPDAIAGQVNLGHLDIAILTLEEKPEKPFPEHLPLADHTASDAVVAEDWFFNVGHPAQPWGSWLVDGEDGNDATISRELLFALIGDRFGVKRLSPGRIDFAPGRFPGDAHAHAITHDATTLGGSSGSGIMAVTPEGPVMSGLHFAGYFGTRNYAHWVPAVAHLHR
ncbi:trypsin-like serine peptidase [Paracoccus tibetensis]|nr:trypsin-like peptidase domain-containing protein [Paracoccus tibetensis]